MRYDVHGNPLFEEKCYTENKIVDGKKLGDDYLKELRNLPRVPPRSRAQSMGLSAEVITKKVNYMTRQRINYKSK